MYLVVILVCGTRVGLENSEAEQSGGTYGGGSGGYKESGLFQIGLRVGEIGHDVVEKLLVI